MAKAKPPPDKYAPHWLESLDSRTGLARDLRERYAAFCSDLGGIDQLSYQQRSLVERALWLEHWLRTEEQRLAAGGAFNVGAWVQACNSLQGILSKLGLERRARDVPDLAEYLRRREAATQ